MTAFSTRSSVRVLVVALAVPAACFGCERGNPQTQPAGPATRKASTAPAGRQKPDGLPALTDADRALIKRGRDAVAGLAATLGDRGRPLQARVRAARLLGEIGPGAADAVGVLATALGEDSSEIRQAAAKALGAIGPGASPARPALAKALKDDHPSVRDSALGAVIRIRSGGMLSLSLWSFTKKLDDPVIVPVLARLLRDRDQAVRRTAAWLLMKRKKPCKEAIAPLIEVLKDNDTSAPGYAAAALIPNGQDARDAVPLLIPLAFRLRHTAAPYMAIEAIGLEPRLIPAVIEQVVAGSTKGARSQALMSWIGVKVLAAAGPAGVPALGRALGHENQTVRLTAARTIQKLGKAAKTDAVAKGLAALIANDRTRAEAAAGLVAIGVSAEAAVPGLIKDLESGQVFLMETTELRYTCRAADVLGTIPQAVGALIKGLHSDKELVRVGCLHALGANAAAAKRTVPKIKAFLVAASTSKVDKEWAVKALYRLAPAWVRRAVRETRASAGTLPPRHWRHIVPAVVHAAKAEAKGGDE